MQQNTQNLPKLQTTVLLLLFLVYLTKIKVAEFNSGTQKKHPIHYLKTLLNRC